MPVIQRSTRGVLPVLLAVVSMLVLSTTSVSAQAAPGKVFVVRGFIAALNQGGAAGVRSFLAPNFTVTLNGSTSSGAAATALLDSLPKPITLVSATPYQQIIQSTAPVNLPQASSATQSTTNAHMIEASLQFASGPAVMASFTGVPGGHILNMTIVGTLPSASATPAATQAATGVSAPVSVAPGSGAVVRNFISSLNQGGSAAAQSYLASNFTLTVNGAAASGSGALALLDSLPKPIAVASLTPSASGGHSVQATLQIGAGPALTAAFSGNTSGHITNLALTGSVPTPVSTPTPAPPLPHGVTVSYQAGWNLVGGPAGTMLTGTDGPLYTYQSSDADYEVIQGNTPLQAGTGYWVLFDAPSVETLPIAASTNVQVSLPPGQPVMVGNPFDVAASVDGADEVWEYGPSAGYVQTSALAPGQGAWAISFNGGTLTIAPTVN